MMIPDPKDMTVDELILDLWAVHHPNEDGDAEPRQADELRRRIAVLRMDKSALEDALSVRDAEIARLREALEYCESQTAVLLSGTYAQCQGLVDDYVGCDAECPGCCMVRVKAKAGSALRGDDG